MSKITVEVLRINKIEEHKNAEKLELCHIAGWQSVVPKGKFKVNDLVVYIPIGASLPDQLAEKIGVKKYLGRGNSVKAAKLRGEPSYGIVVNPLDIGLPKVHEGKDLTNKLGIVKYIPGEVQPPNPSISNKVRRWIKTNLFKLLRITGKRPQVVKRGKHLLVQHPLFHIYTDMDNLRKHPSKLDGLEVVVTEKIHGCNSRIGLIKEDGKWREVYGSHYSFCPGTETRYYFPFTKPEVKTLLYSLLEVLNPKHSIVIYGEMFGGSIQGEMQYKVPKGSIQYGYKIFDIKVDDKYIDFTQLEELVPTDLLVPIINRGAFTYSELVKMAEGKTLINEAGHIREGIVVKPVKELHDPKLGRVIFKYPSDDYLCGNFESDTEPEL